MKSIFQTLCLIALSASLVSASSVVDLTPDNFDKVVDGSKHALVEFFAPWCGHCKNLAPVYEELADNMSKHKDSLIIAKVDADKYKDLGGKYDVQGFPTIKWFPKGSKSPEEYTGGRELENFVEFISEKTGIKSKIKKPHSFVKEFNGQSLDEIMKDPKKSVLLEFYAPWCGHCKNLAPIYEKVALDFATESDCIVAKIDATQHRDIAEKYSVTGYPQMKFFKAGSKAESPIHYTGDRTEEAFVNFLNENCGTDRAIGGGFGLKAGRIDALDELIPRLLAGGEEAATVIAEATKIAAKSTESTAQYYIRVFEKVIKNGRDYAKKEVARLKKLVESETITKDKKDDFNLRINVLTAITSFKEGAQKVFQAIEDEL